MTAELTEEARGQYRRHRVIYVRVYYMVDQLCPLSFVYFLMQ